LTRTARTFGRGIHAFHFIGNEMHAQAIARNPQVACVEQDDLPAEQA
jgi:hypothetical protein